ncbi:paladin-like isoform X2 [Biomphalaria glabrata]|uniref:Paladin-like isoform X2 n=1 Tax=Biomphalaria glabrata TaxID=6526 RepID=A0A9W2ZRK8_BIOGL|nr:paladin-like isoform X2 [Biomphalaria glabrata]
MGSSASTLTPPSSPPGRVWQASAITTHALSEDGARLLAESSLGTSLRLPSNNQSRTGTVYTSLDTRGSQQTLTGTDMYAGKQCVVRTNKVAPVIIKDCREEFQQFLEISEPIIHGSLAEGMLEHPLIKGKYFIVQDFNDVKDTLQTYRLTSAPNFHQASSDQPIFASGQPTVNGLGKVLTHLMSDSHTILLLNLRSEPILFQRVDDDYVPYSVRHQENIHNMVMMGDTKDSCDHIESCIRKEIVSLAGIEDEFVFYFYDNLDKLQQEPHIRKVEFEEDILLSNEVYAREAFSNPSLRYDRICLPEMGIPTEDLVDQFLSHFRESPAYLDKNNPAFPAVYLISHSGGRRSAIMMVMSCLIYAHKKGTLVKESSHIINPKHPNYNDGEYQAVQKLVNHLTDGNLIKQQVDSVIDECSQVINLRTCIIDHKKKLEAAAFKRMQTDSFVEHVHAGCLSALETYCFLITFNAYLRDQMPNNLSWSYNKWLHRNPEVIRLCSQLDFSELSSPPSLLSSQHRVLVYDDYIGLDVLSSQMDIKVSNFRRLMGLPIYGMAQPTRKGLSKVVNHLLHHKQGYSNVIVVNLRSDYVLEVDETSYSVRDMSNLAEPIHSQCSSGKDLEEMEQKLKKELRSKKVWKAYKEITSPAVDIEVTSVFTPEELYEQQRLSTLDMHYRRLPLQYDHCLNEQEFDEIQDLILSFMKESGSWVDNSHAFVFHCRTGKSRTSLTMAVAGLLFYHMTGFPYGANPDEQERVSCPNARYTKGEYLVVEKLIWMLPDGHQVKREVDLVLDRLFETMSPMHFHLREVIFVVFNKGKSTTGAAKRYMNRLSYDFLERYLYLILYNAYLHMEKSGHFQRSFTRWMTEVAAPAGVYELLDNLGFFTLESSPSEFSRLKNRILDRQQKLPFSGVFV